MSRRRTLYPQLLEEAAYNFVNGEDVYPFPIPSDIHFLPYEIGAAVVDTLVSRNLDPAKNKLLQHLLEQGVELKVENWKEIEKERQLKAEELNESLNSADILDPKE
jgi:hypothetical protein